DGKALAVSHESSHRWGDGGFSLIDTTTGQTIRSWKAPGTDEVQFAPDGRTLLAVEMNKLRLWDTVTGRDAVPFDGPRQDLEAPVFSRDGVTMATREDDGFIRLWETRTGKQKQRLVHDDWFVLHHLAFADDGQKLVATAVERAKDGAAVVD